jgi:hypothetical protein
MDHKEYERRRSFLDALKKLHTSEYIDIVRILKQEQVEYSENTNGVFFDVAKLTQKTFDVLEKYVNFVHTNRKSLAERETLMNKLQDFSKRIL